jgi:hypothetical protein
MPPKELKGSVFRKNLPSCTSEISEKSTLQIAYVIDCDVIKVHNKVSIRTCLGTSKVVFLTSFWLGANPLFGPVFECRNFLVIMMRLSDTDTVSDSDSDSASGHIHAGVDA